MKKRGYVNNDNYEIVRYGIELLAMKTIICTVILIIGCVTRSLVEVLVFMSVYQPLRSYAGGYHAKSKAACIIASTFMLFLVIVLTKIPVGFININISMIITLICSIIIFLFAPVDTVTKPFDDIEKIVFRRRSRIVLIIILLMMLGVYIIKFQEILLVASLALLCVAILLVVGKIQNKTNKVKVLVK